MTLEEKLTENLKTAMRDKDEAAKRTIRSIKAAIQIFKTSGANMVLDEAKEVAILQKLVKQRRDSIEQFEKGGHTDRVQIEQEELEIIQKYLPIMLEGAELEAVISGIIAQVGATSVKDLGKVMGAANNALKGKAEGKAISDAVKKLLGNL